MNLSGAVPTQDSSPWTVSYGNLVYKLTLVLSILIFFQQVLVINVGGSFKTYEMVGFIFLAMLLIHRRDLITRKDTFPLLLFLVVAPLLSLIQFYFNDSIRDYYLHYQEAKQSLRLDYRIAPFLIYAYYCMAFAVFIQISSSQRVFKHKRTILRFFVVAALMVSFYSIYSIFGVFLLGLPDLVPEIVDFRNTKGGDLFRAAGFSDEPGVYIFVQMWAFVYLATIPGLFSRRLQILIATIVGGVLLLTFSTSILAVPAAFGIYFMLKEDMKKKLLFMAGLLCIVALVYFLAWYFDYLDEVLYIVGEKLKNFLFGSHHTGMMESGSFRQFSAKLGFEIFKDYPIFGVGAGNSIFFMWQNLPQVESITSTLAFDIPPQNTYIQILAETGLAGFICFAVFMVRGIAIPLQKRVGRMGATNPMLVAGWIGTLASCILLIAIYPIHSLFMWFHWALIHNELRYGATARKQKPLRPPGVGTVLDLSDCR